MTLMIDAEFEGKLTCAYKIDMKNLTDFHHTTFESLKIGTFVGSFSPRQKMYELKIYRGVMCHDNEE